MRKRISIHQLRVGMYVAGLDCSWFQTPFFKHRFLVHTEEQIERLRRSNIRAVDIDPSKGLDVALLPIDEDTLQAISQQTSLQTALAPAPLPDTARSLGSLAQELELARATQQKLVQSVKTVFTEIERRGLAPPELISETVQEITIVTRTLATHAMVKALSLGRTLDDAFNNHNLAVCTLSMLIGQTLGYNPKALHELATGALLHDIGLLQLPNHLRHTSSPLSGEDLITFQQHPRLGAILLEAQRDFPQIVRRIAAEHHVTPDGQGYPTETSAGFTAEASRIVMVADRYDELLTGFGGLRPLPPHAAIQHLFQEGEFGRLDLRLVSLFIKLIGIYPVYSFVELNTKERGLITTINPAALHRPVVALTYDQAGSPYRSPLTVDLDHQGPSPLRAIDHVVASELDDARHEAAATREGLPGKHATEDHTLLVSQRFDRIHPGGFVGRVQPEKQTNHQ